MTRNYLKQLLSGRDIAVRNPAALQMVNFSYLIGDLDAGVCVAVDPSWGPEELVALATADGLRLVGVLATHHHADHVGGDLWGYKVPGVAELLRRAPVPVHVHRLDAGALLAGTRIPRDSVVAHEDGDTLEVGGLRVRVLHTPGHTPGSSCFIVEDCIFTGDTLFIEGCGRVDLPGGDSSEMSRSLGERIAALPGSLVVLPGHEYGGDRATLDHVRRVNPALRTRDRARWERENF
jgi:glyoxylase-like metal-dependent hydrolase (beta-lactamase superfamily II)